MKITLKNIEDFEKTGVYLITNTLNGKVYVGSTTNNFRIRIVDHIRKLKDNRHHNSYLQSSILKNGIEYFEFSIIEIIEEKETIRKRESFFIDLYDSANPLKGYNLSNETHKPPINKEIREKISNTLKKKYLEDRVFVEKCKKAWENKAGKPSWNAGKTCKNISDARKEMFDDIEVYDINMNYLKTFDNPIEIEKYSLSEECDLPMTVRNTKKINSANIRRAIRENKSYKGLFFKKVPRGTIKENG